MRSFHTHSSQYYTNLLPENDITRETAELRICHKCLNIYEVGPSKNRPSGNVDNYQRYYQKCSCSCKNLNDRNETWKGFDFNIDFHDII